MGVRVVDESGLVPARVDVPAEDVCGAEVHEVHERLREVPDWAGRFGVVDRWLLRALSRRDGTRAAGSPAPVAGARERLLASGGRLRVDAPAAGAGYSERHLRNRFREEVGLTPKAAARVVRFDRARRRLAAAAGPGVAGLAGLAADCGYADRSPLDREFAALASCTPSAWLAEECRSVRAGHRPGV
ncbi:helix-turn-helix domain-containing protein [Streptomyces sp. WAC06614]|uniref:helix-turn-helix domain-containing protein n=1 Tax=Streptomyces sp. WAC06614 TaxID=2487416 RepID=UPI000F79A695|nr:helix-turn-helix domain-containing protein [Streptomyces sp. WAC06614]RSS81025.1 AraC family transcriptional regulator [Streptomyces sp. WAC06614]